MAARSAAPRATRASASTRIERILTAILTDFASIFTAASPTLRIANEAMARSRTPAPRPLTGAPGRPGLPAERAFVIQLRADADLARGIVRGRIEHVLTGTATQFESLAQLVGCMQDVVAQRARGPRMRSS